MQSNVIEKLADVLQQESNALARGDLTSARQAGTEKVSLVAQLTMLDPEDKAAHAGQLRALQETMRKNMALLARAQKMSERVLQGVAAVVDPPKRTRSYSGQARSMTQQNATGRGLALNTDI